MTNPGTVEIETGAVRAHAHDVIDLKSRVDLVVDAGRQVSPPGLDVAYGMLCQPFPIATEPVTTAILAGLRLLTNVYGSTANELAATADSWDDTDSANSDTLNGVGGMLDDAQGGVPQ